jgi:hypothetical protein
MPLDRGERHCIDRELDERGGATILEARSHAFRTPTGHVIQRRGGVLWRATGI